MPVRIWSVTRAAVTVPPAGANLSRRDEVVRTPSIGGAENAACFACPRPRLRDLGIEDELLNPRPILVSEQAA